MIYIQEHQSILDIAIQEDGSVLSAFEWAIRNGLSVTSSLSAGQEMQPPISNFRNDEVANYFKGKKQDVATGLKFNVREALTPQVGIGTMIIESTFIVAP